MIEEVKCKKQDREIEIQEHEGPYNVAAITTREPSEVIKMLSELLEMEERCERVETVSIFPLHSSFI